MKNLFDGCFSGEHQKLMSPQNFQHTFCRVCRNLECEISGINRTQWIGRMDTQVERLLTNPAFADINDPRFKEIVSQEFADKFREAMAIEVSSAKGDWSIPTEEDLVEYAAKMALQAAPQGFQQEDAPESSEEKILWEGTAKGSAGKTYGLKLLQKGNTETWSCTCPSFTIQKTGTCKHIAQAQKLYADQLASEKETEPKPPVLKPLRTDAPPIMPPMGNTRFPSEGVMLDGTNNTPEPDPWAAPVKTNRGTVVPIHGKVVMGSGKR